MFVPFSPKIVFRILLLLTSNFIFAQKEPELDKLAISWKVITNAYKEKDQVRCSFTLYNKSTETLTGNWEMYFNLPRMVLKDNSGNADIQQVNGDLFKLIPSKTFSLKPADSTSIEFTAALWLTRLTDAPSGLYFVSSKNIIVPVKHYSVKPFTQKEQHTKCPVDTEPLPTPALTYAENKQLYAVAEDSLFPVIPVPVEYHYGKSEVKLTADYFIHAPAELSHEKQFLEQQLTTMLGSALGKAGQKKIELRIDERLKGGQLKEEGYKLLVREGFISITGADAAGVFYGIQSLLAMLPAEAWKQAQAVLNLREIDLLDYPRFAYRGMFLDVARNFHGKKTVLKLLDMMAFYKLNKFHFHLSDDEGWRLEIPGLPELTEIGAYRKHGPDKHGMLPTLGSGPFGDPGKSSGSGFYSREEFIEIIKYAHRRHIEVIPEVDMPGHIRAAVVAMNERYKKYMKDGNKELALQFLLREPEDSSKYLTEQMWNDNTLCPCIEGPYNFVGKIVDELKQMYKQAGTELYTFHIGGDEVAKGVWEKSPACLANKKVAKEISTMHDYYFVFVKKVVELLEKKGVKTNGWEEVGLVNEQHINEKGEKVIRQVPGLELATKQIQLNYWNSIPGWGNEDLAYRLANAGYKVIMSNVNFLYFDMAYSKDPEEPGYYWGGSVGVKKPFEFIPLNYLTGVDKDRMGNSMSKQQLMDGKVKLTERGKQNLIGIQGHLWTETVKDSARVDYMVYPRMIALAQRAWAPNPQWADEKDDVRRNTVAGKEWNLLANTIGKKDFRRMDGMFGGITYAIPMPGAIVENGFVKLNSSFPGLLIRYTTNGAEPDSGSPIYQAPIPLIPGITLKARCFNLSGRAGRTMLLKL